MWKRATVLCAGAIAALVIAGCGGEESGGGQPEAHGTSATTPVPPATSAADHNDADVMFAQHMIPHHQQAIDMSDVVLAEQGIDPRVTELATAIKAAQGREIAQMHGWLEQWGNPPMPTMGAGEGHGGGHGMEGTSGNAMGMMSDEQMSALKGAEGIDASKLFLRGMITHHEGAIDMAQDEIDGGKFAPAVDLARSIVETQQREIHTMKGILETL